MVFRVSHEPAKIYTPLEPSKQRAYIRGLLKKCEKPPRGFNLAEQIERYEHHGIVISNVDEAREFLSHYRKHFASMPAVLKHIFEKADITDHEKAELGNDFLVKICRLHFKTLELEEIFVESVKYLALEVPKKGDFKPSLDILITYLKKAPYGQAVDREVCEAFLKALGEVDSHIEKFAKEVPLSAKTLPFYEAADFNYGMPIKGVVPFAKAPIELLEKLDEAFIGESELHRAVKDDDSDKAQALITECPFILYTMDEEGNSPLHLAVEEGRHEMVALFANALHEGYLPQNRKSQTPLHLAILRRDSQMVKALTQEGVKYENKKYSVESHLMLALNCGYSEFADDLLSFEKRFSCIPLFVTHFATHPLIESAKRGDLQTIAWLKEKGVKVEDREVFETRAKELIALTELEGGMELFRSLFDTSPHENWKIYKQILNLAVKAQNEEFVKVFLEVFTDESDRAEIFYSEMLPALYYSRFLFEAGRDLLDIRAIFDRAQSDNKKNVLEMVIEIAPEQLFAEDDLTLLPIIQKLWRGEFFKKALQHAPLEVLERYVADGSFPLMQTLCDLEDRELFRRCFPAIPSDQIQRALNDGETLFKERWVDIAVEEGLIEEELFRQKAQAFIERENFLYQFYEKGQGPFYWAVAKRNCALVQQMIPHLKDGLIPQHPNYTTALDIAISNRDVAMIEVLTQDGLYMHREDYPNIFYPISAIENCPEADLDRIWDFECASLRRAGLTPTFDPNISSHAYLFKICFDKGDYKSCVWLLRKGVPITKDRCREMIYKLIETPESEETIEIFRYLSPHLVELENEKLLSYLHLAMNHSNEVFARFFLDWADLHHPEYSRVATKIVMPHAEEKLMKLSVDFRVEFFRRMPISFYYSDLINYTWEVRGERVCEIYKKEALMGRFGLTEESANSYVRRVFETLSHGIDSSLYYRTLFLACECEEDLERLLKVSQRLVPTFPGASYTSQEREKVFMEFYHHIFPSFRPELLKSEEALEHLADTWEMTQSKEEKALFFNALQSQVSVEKIRPALLGMRSIEDESSDPLERLAYIEVARFQKGKALACELYQKHYDNFEVQLAALAALASLAVPLDAELIELMEEQLQSEKTDLRVREGIARLFWRIQRNPEDHRIKEFALQALEDEVGLDTAFELLDRLNIESEKVVPKLLELSQRPDKPLRIQVAFVLAQIEDEKALLRALEIVQSSDWDGYDNNFRHEELGHRGAFSLFVRKPPFQDNRSSMVQRICDRLAQISKADISQEVHALAANGDTSIFKTGRYLSHPIYFPKGTLVRGVCDRKGNALLFEAMRDLIRHGAQTADLSYFGGEFENATWCKIGHIFASSDHSTSYMYSSSMNSQYGAVVVFDSSYYNEENLHGRGRIETEGSINTVLYQGIPWPYIKKIYFPTECEADIQALYDEMPIDELELTSPLFKDLTPDELQEMRFYLHQSFPRIADGEIVEETTVFERIAFGKMQDEVEIDFDSILKKSLKRKIQRDVVKKFYYLETAMQDEILEGFSDVGFALAIPRLLDIFKPGIENHEQLKKLKTEHLSPAMRKVARLATLYRGGDLKQLREKQPLHRAPVRDIRLVEALIQDLSFEKFIEIEPLTQLSKLDYEELIKTMG